MNELIYFNGSLPADKKGRGGLSSEKMEQVKCFQRIKDLWGTPITLIDGVNENDENFSEHCRGIAFDITAGTQKENKKLFNMIKKSNIPITSIIPYDDYFWLHITY